MKKLIFIFITLLALTAVFTSTSFASATNPKGGINQSGGCNTKYFTYHYKDSKGKNVFGRMKVGVCINEHYSSYYSNYAMQTDIYFSTTGAPATCEVDLYIYRKTDNSYNDKVFYCPNNGEAFQRYDQGVTVQRLYKLPGDNPIWDSNTLNDRFFGKAKVWIHAPSAPFIQGYPKMFSMGYIELVSPSLTMR